ncbi:hypothetical protein PKHYL_39830 [Psychrobacter sp. KH172YL61]|nr:hypothetical protein PKHYL_39830 [Psychrobacter sp. KH172YL61]
MKKITTLSISALASAMLLMTGCSTNNGSQETAAQSVSITEQSSASEKVGYSLGFMMAEGNKEAVKDLNLDTFEKGFRDGYEGNDSALTQEQMQEVLMTYQKEQEEQFAKDMQTKATENKTAGTAFLAENAKKKA